MIRRIKQTEVNFTEIWVLGFGIVKLSVDIILLLFKKINGFRELNFLKFELTFVLSVVVHFLFLIIWHVVSDIRGTIINFLGFLFGGSCCVLGCWDGGIWGSGGDYSSSCIGRFGSVRDREFCSWRISLRFIRGNFWSFSCSCSCSRFITFCFSFSINFIRGLDTGQDIIFRDKHLGVVGWLINCGILLSRNYSPSASINSVCKN